jgi:hypothetical protein
MGCHSDLESAKPIFSTHKPRVQITPQKEPIFKDFLKVDAEFSSRTAALAKLPQSSQPLDQHWIGR